MDLNKKYILVQEKFLGGRTLKYSILENCNNSYGINLSVLSKNNTEEVYVENISNNKNFIINLISILYENAIDTIHFKDIIEDKIIDYKN